MALAKKDIEKLFTDKGYVKYNNHNFYDNNTFTIKFGRDAAHIRSKVNGKNSGWANATHIILPYEANVNIIAEANSGHLLGFLNTKLNDQKSNVFIYHPQSAVGDSYLRYVISKGIGQSQITPDAAPDQLTNLIPNYVAPAPATNADDDVERPEEKPPTTERFKDDLEQIIFYGVPGCGKSTIVVNRLEERSIDADHYKRVVFYSDYTNSDFIGQIFPKVKDNIVKYKFKAGPFSEILRKAYENPAEPYCLVIEEINRGNAPAIFGDIFQLLDRKPKNSVLEISGSNGYGEGWSDFSISNSNINAYIRGEYDDLRPEDFDCRGFGDITFDENTEIRLPSNLSIYATMNTSDQNVFTLDNAFQRRWKMELVPNKFDFDDDDQKNQFYTKLEGTNFFWGVFQKIINQRIVKATSASSFSSLEDKRIGCWFVKPDKKDEDGQAIISKDLFVNKVIKFLWDDAFKFERSIFTNSHEKTFEDVHDDFLNSEIGMNIFDEDFNRALDTEQHAQEDSLNNNGN